MRAELLEKNEKRGAKIIIWDLLKSLSKNAQGYGKESDKLKETRAQLDIMSGNLAKARDLNRSFEQIDCLQFDVDDLVKTVEELKV